MKASKLTTSNYKPANLSQKPSGVLWSLLFCLLIPMIILNKLSGEAYLGVKISIVVAFIFGALFSAWAGNMGMKIATKTNVRTTQAAITSLPNALKISFGGGTVMGLGVAGLAVLGLTTFFIIFFNYFMGGVWTSTEEMTIVLETLAGFSLGVVDEENMIGTNGPKNEDVLIGVSSSGFHSNGFSLIRKVLENYKISLDDDIEGERLGTILLKPTNIYVQEVLNLSKLLRISSIAHITGGGFFENIPRMLNKNQKVDIAFNFSDWPAYKYFKWIQDTAKISEENMLKTFNCGIGLIIAVSPEDEEMALGTLNQSSFYAKTIGAVYEKQGNEPELNFV